ncbi:MAG: YigZ family protein, partial [Thermoanaerobaculia bacterium]|nr:YigZ family protein [Thermoanaerobaculia bacterium]
RAPSTISEAEIRERGSRFRARIVPVRDEPGAKAELERIRQDEPSATHHCWAWRLGWPATARSSDAGEPSGTAGAPILRAVEAAGVSDCLLVVSRWFGGTKLGRGGLVRAYGAAARACLERAALVERTETRRVVVELPYDRMGGLERRLGSEEVVVREQSFGESVRLELEIESGRLAWLLAELANLGPSVRARAVEEERASREDSR